MSSIGYAGGWGVLPQGDCGSLPRSRARSFSAIGIAAANRKGLVVEGGDEFVRGGGDAQAAGGLGGDGVEMRCAGGVGVAEFDGAGA